ncbi:hypothetical protein NDU88_011439 [Pleurodeles waltl]|uniref:Uncharacterized protein n=1 Tax=Pleurodeles waltl TaxID=8319 RepID=A0AAV7PYF4_PLEWA|nr:hypothetical protein NDU88_011438 [Pleurodeles waltl]KAJ1133142.1 hypothetical protein NDU88_011439 [Pleurodeles waltl]
MGGGSRQRARGQKPHNITGITGPAKPRGGRDGGDSRQRAGGQKPHNITGITGSAKPRGGQGRVRIHARGPEGRSHIASQAQPSPGAGRDGWGFTPEGRSHITSQASQAQPSPGAGRDGGDSRQRAGGQKPHKITGITGPAKPRGGQGRVGIHARGPEGRSHIASQAQPSPGAGRDGWGFTPEGRRAEAT